MLQHLEEWGFALSRTLQGQLEAGSWSALLAVFAGGVLTSFTPCVYPMIPVTVTFIGGASAGDRRRAVSLSLVYVVGLALVYATLGIAAATLGKQFGAFTHTPVVYVAVGLLMALFGVAMLGVLDVPVPGFFGRLQHQGVRRGGHLGALLMGAAAGFVAAPCTAPVLGVLLLYIARTRDVPWGGLLMLCFALGLGLLLMLLGIFSGLLAGLPRAGAWMNWVKRVFGVAMLALAAWFLIQAARMAL
ncbi:MAG TPA: cytochrome c biogenesis protein CcdA [Candidatus Polarisedimenticolaceae bacterium]|nr:cytochrome c biogenesis protein CcdA [Candidatus Polarisedimenticolaceae bacterium]